MIRAGQTERREHHTVLLSLALLRSIAQSNGVKPIPAGGYEYAMIRKPHRDRVTVYQAPLAVAS